MSTAEIRISDDERNQAVAMLGEHLTSGRLELAEYEDRCGRAVAARTRGELEELFTDLPAPHPDLSSATPPLIQKAGQLVSMPTRGKKDVVQTPASKAFEVVAGAAFLVGIPVAILLTALQGLWWVFIPVGVVLIVAGGVSDALKKPGP
jgi:uncharacterized protein DUF1707